MTEQQTCQALAQGYGWQGRHGKRCGKPIVKGGPCAVCGEAAPVIWIHRAGTRIEACVDHDFERGWVHVEYIEGPCAVVDLNGEQFCGESPESAAHRQDTTASTHTYVQPYREVQRDHDAQPAPYITTEHEGNTLTITLRGDEFEDEETVRAAILKHGLFGESSRGN